MGKVKVSKKMKLRVRISPKFIQRILNWHFQTYLLKKARPLVLACFVTGSCHYKCKMCDVHLRPMNLHMSFEQFKALIDETKSTVAYMSIGGGEPLLVPNLTNYLAYAKKNIPYVHLNTNGGLITERIAKEFEKIKLDDVSISLDGPPDLFAEYRGVSRAYDNVLKSIRLLKEHAPGTKITINTIIAHWNYKHIPSLLNLTEELGIYHQFQPLTDLFGMEYEEKYVNAISKIPEEEVIKITKLLLSKKHVVNSNSYLSGFPYFFRTGKTPHNMKKCYTAKTQLEANYDGKFKTCGYVLGKLKEFDMKNLKETLDSKEYYKYTESLCHNCNLCDRSYNSCYWEQRFSYPLTSFVKNHFFKPKIKY